MTLHKMYLGSMLPRFCSSWARAGDSSPRDPYDIRYAAPELLAADLRGVRLDLLSIYALMNKMHLGSGPCLDSAAAGHVRGQQPWSPTTSATLPQSCWVPTCVG